MVENKNMIKLKTKYALSNTDCTSLTKIADRVFFSVRSAKNVFTEEFLQVSKFDTYFENLVVFQHFINYPIIFTLLKSNLTNWCFFNITIITQEFFLYLNFPIQ